MENMPNSVVHRTVASQSLDNGDSVTDPSSISSLPMYASDLNSATPKSSSPTGFDSNEKSFLSEDYDYDHPKHKHSKSGLNSFYSKKNSFSFLNLPNLYLAFKGDNSQTPFGSKSGYSKNNNVKSLLMWLVAIFVFGTIVYPILSFFEFNSGFNSEVGLPDNSVLTLDPLIYPDLDALFRLKTSGSSGSNHQASKKSPTDHTFDLSDKEMPAAAKKNHPGVAAGGVAGSNMADEKSNDLLKDGTQNNIPKNSNSEFQNRNKVLGSLKFQSPTKESSFFSFGKSANNLNKSPELVIVTGINPEKYSISYLEKIIENRKKYAQKWGHALYIRLLTDFRKEYESTATKNPSWAKLPILRAAIQAFPEAKHIWNLDAHVLIEDMDTNIVSDLIDPAALSSKIERDRPIVRFSNVIKTYKNMSPTNSRLILAPDETGISTASFILANLDLDSTIDYSGTKNNRYNVKKYKGGRHGSFAISLLEYWFDPTSRSYLQYDKSESSALNHILQWHPSILSRSAIVSGRELMSYSAESVANKLGLRGVNLKLAYQLPKEEGEMTIEDYENDGLVFHYQDATKRCRVVTLSSCALGSSITCLKEMSKYSSIQTKLDTTGSTANPPKQAFGNDQQKKQQAQAQEAQARAQANDEAVGSNELDGINNIDAQIAASIARKKRISEVEARVAADIARQKKSNDIQAQIAKDLAKQKKANDIQAQIAKDIAKKKEAEDIKKKVLADIAKEKQTHQINDMVIADIAKKREANKLQAQGLAGENVQEIVGVENNAQKVGVVGGEVPGQKMAGGVEGQKIAEGLQGQKIAEGLQGQKIAGEIPGQIIAGEAPAQLVPGAGQAQKIAVEVPAQIPAGAIQI